MKVHYETTWFRLQKMRIAMGNRNAQYKLEGEVEVDEVLTTVIDLNEDENENNFAKNMAGEPQRPKCL